MRAISHFSVALVHAGLVTLLGACGCSNGDSTPLDYLCYASWYGRIPATDTLSIEACVTAGMCSEATANRYAAGNAPDERDAAQEADCMLNPALCGGNATAQIPLPFPGFATWSATWADLPVDESPGAGEWLDFGVGVDFDERVASALSADTRSKLTVKGATGETLVDSIAQDPYTTYPAPNPCKTAYLNLDGSPRPL